MKKANVTCISFFCILAIQLRTIENRFKKMNNVSTINRDEILNNAKRESELSDLKQHADKMIRGFENFNNYSSNRAV